MPRADRASQFMPFAALKGFEEALAAKEKIIVPKVELSEDALEYLDFQLSKIQIGDRITVVYYEDDAYVKKSGMVTKINPQAGYLTIVTTDIGFEDIRDIQF